MQRYSYIRYTPKNSDIERVVASLTTDNIGSFYEKLESCTSTVRNERLLKASKFLEKKKACQLPWQRRQKNG